MNSRDRLELLVKGPYKACARTIFMQITSQYTKGAFSEVRKKVQKDIDYLMDAIDALVDSIVARKELTATFVPTIVSVEKARNLKMNIVEPTKDDLYDLLYIQLSGIPYGEVVANLLNVNEDALEDFRGSLLSHEIVVESKNRYMIDIERLQAPIKKLPLPQLWDYPSIFAFVFLNYFVHFYKTGKKEVSIEAESLLRDWGITDSSSLVVFHIPGRGEKRSMHIFSGLASFIRRWYGEYLSNKEEEYPSLGLFIASLYSAHKDFRDTSANLLSKFLQYFLNGYVSGEILTKLLTLKIEAMFQQKAGGFLRSSSFFTLLTEGSISPRTRPETY